MGRKAKEKRSRVSHHFSDPILTTDYCVVLCVVCVCVVGDCGQN